MGVEDDIDDKPIEAWTLKLAPSNGVKISSSQPDLERDHGFDDKPREVWTRTTTSLLKKLMVVGKFSYL